MLALHSHRRLTRAYRWLCFLGLLASSAVAQTSEDAAGSEQEKSPAPKTVPVTPSDEAKAAPPGGESSVTVGNDATKEPKVEDLNAELEDASSGPQSSMAAPVVPAPAGASARVAQGTDSSPPGSSEKAAASTKASAPEGKGQTEAELVNKPGPPPPTVDYSQFPSTYHQERFDLSAGVRVHWVADSNYSMLADSSALPLFNLRAAGTVWTQERMSLALSGEWDVGKSGGSARNVPTSMLFNRFQLGAEGRYHFLHRLAGYGRFSTGLALLSSRLGEAGEFTEMATSQALFTGALTAGAAFRFAGSPDGRKRGLRAHLFVEAGYSYISRAKLEYEMNDEGPLRPEAVDLGRLSLSGAEFSTGLILSF